MGIDPSLFSIERRVDSTVVTLRIPHQLKPVEIISRIKERIIKDVQELPPFPASINRIMELCNDPDSSLDAISGGIMSDPALSSGVIKLSNSAAFISGKRIENVFEAVRILGLRNIRSMIMASSARRIIEQRYGQYEKIWDHSNRVACYARYIGQSYYDSGVAEKASLAGLLHDLGKIILLATDSSTAKKISEQFKDRMLITETFMEEISIGISHSTIGGLVAEGWNFPEYLVDAIRLHHAPLNATKASEPVVHVVYLANMISGIEANKYEYHYLYENILEHYRLLDQKSFDALHATLRNLYKT
jgi:HD-like signal output (HDOD) protein